MGLANATELTASIKAWLNRSDVADPLVVAIPDFIKLVETEVQTELDDPNQYTSAALTLDVNGNANLPTDFGGVVSIADSTYGGLTQVSSAQFGDFLPISGGPRIYAITNNRFSVLPSGPGSVTVLYRLGIPPLASNATNWLLTRLPGIYLYGVLRHAEFMGWNDDRLPTINATYADLMARLMSDGARRKHGGSPLAPRLHRT